MNDAERLWAQCSVLLKTQVSEPVWLMSFDAAVPVALEEERLTVTVPSFLAKERIERRYLSLVHDALTEAGGGDIELVVEVVAPEPEPEPVWHAATPQQEVPQAPRGTPHERFTFETFVTGNSNRFAHAAALAVAETPAVKYNPLFVYGDAGLGKTHLLHAISHYVTENYPNYRVRYVTSETFLNEFIDAVRSGTNDVFKRRYRDVDVLLVDDIQFIEGKKETQEEFFHTFNALHAANRQIVLSSDRPPDAIATLEVRMRSRFQQGLITDILPPDLETRMAILRNRAEREAIPVPDDVITYVATHITDNIRVLEGALTRVVAWASLTEEPLTVESAARLLADLVSERQPRPITPKVIIDATAEMFGFPREEILGKKRQRPLVTARQVAMYVFRELTDLSYPAIAREFGGRDHTTVIHAVEKITAQMRTHREIYDQVTELLQTIRGAT